MRDTTGNASEAVLLNGQSFTDLPADFFIPPDALLILLDTFTGPLDVLLYLIRKQHIDMLNIPVALITQQYMQYINLLEVRRTELAADYLVMAAMLVEIKSRLLLPVQTSIETGVEHDPRMELVRRLQAYEQIKSAAFALDELPRMHRDVFPVCIRAERVSFQTLYPEVPLSAVIKAMQRVLEQQHHVAHHQIKREVFSVEERMTMVLHRLSPKTWLLFDALLTLKEGRAGLVVTFLAILELVRQSLIKIIQASVEAPLQLRTQEYA